jgi:D-tyrosyl-tRNA(Tyr) deacylase
MRAVIQRVSRAEVRVNGDRVGAIGRGLAVLLGVAGEDGPADVAYVAGKIRDLRIFPDEEGRMNRSVVEAGGDVIVVSQFTLYGDCRRGRRPSFITAAAPEAADARFQDVVAALRASGLRVETGIFQAMMDVELVNDGPVTILIDSTKAF